MDYEVIVTKRAEELVESCIHYLLFELANEQAASRLLGEIERIYLRLQENPPQFPVCRDIYLRSRRYRKAMLPGMRYAFIYKIEEDTVYILGFFHEPEEYGCRL